MITADSFRVDLPEFSDTTKYTDPAINYWIAIGGLLLPTCSWGDGSADAVNPPSTIYDFGLEMFVAHNLVLEALAKNSANAGGVPGLSGTGLTASKSVGGVSISYDVNAGIIEGAGHWNYTTYGVRFIQLARLRGAGPVQISPTPMGTGAAAWFGPPVGPYGPNGF